MLLGEEPGRTTGRSSLSAFIARCRSYRHIHRIALVVFVLSTIFVLERYHAVFTSAFQITSAQQQNRPDPVHVPGSNTHYEPPPEADTHYEPHPEADTHYKPHSEADTASSQGKPKYENMTPEQLLELSKQNAGNATLGFHSIKYINMKARYDREDAMALQAYMSGLEIEDVPAVEADTIDPAGMPPTHRPGKLRTGEKGCWRAHANVGFHFLSCWVILTLLKERSIHPTPIQETHCPSTFLPSQRIWPPCTDIYLNPDSFFPFPSFHPFPYSIDSLLTPSFHSPSLPASPSPYPSTTRFAFSFFPYTYNSY